MQRTLNKKGSFTGTGLHTGNKTTITFNPSPDDSGIKFVRTDLKDRPVIEADIDHVVETDRGTTISLNGVKIHTVEHVLASISGLEIDNVRIELNGSEPPVGDGSSLPFVDTIKKAGIKEGQKERDYYVIRKPYVFSDGDVHIVANPADNLKVSFTIDYPNPIVKSQYISLSIDPKTFSKEIAPARTYCFAEDVERLRSKGLIKGGSFDNAIVITKDGFMNETPLRFPNEFVRHKIIDLLGDLALLGGPLNAHIISIKSGHRTNVKFIQKLKKYVQKEKAGSFDISNILEVMPHRYPFLLVDRIIELEPKRVVGIKNVTFNEPYFQGHFPGVPVMPGVLIVEAMAQVGGFLLLHSVEKKENKLVYFVGIDGIKFRRPVKPGDQIRFELNLLKHKARMYKMSGHAYVDNHLVCEGELLAQVVEKPDGNR